MKKILGLAAVLVLTAGLSHAGDSFGVVVGPHGFGLHFDSHHGRWLPPPPLPPPVHRYHAGWWPYPFYWGKPRGLWQRYDWDRWPKHRHRDKWRGHRPHGRHGLHDRPHWRDDRRAHPPRDRHR